MNINTTVKMYDNKTIEFAVLATTVPNMDVIAVEASTLTLPGYSKAVSKMPAVLVMKTENGEELRTTEFTARADWKEFAIKDAALNERITELMPWSSVGSIRRSEVLRNDSGWTIVATGPTTSDYLQLSSIYFTV